jgi:hypothetical protein
LTCLPDGHRHTDNAYRHPAKDGTMVNSLHPQPVQYKPPYWQKSVADHLVSNQQWIYQAAAGDAANSFFCDIDIIP